MQLTTGATLRALLLFQLASTLLALQLNGDTRRPYSEAANENTGNSVWPPLIPMWSFLPNKAPAASDQNTGFSVLQRNEQHLGTSEDANSHPNDISLRGNEIVDQDMSTLLEARDFKNFKRSSSLPYAESFQKNDIKRSRPYDVPQIECPLADDGMERFACPTPDTVGRYRCVDDHVLCDGFIDCPNAEDENRQACMFYKTTKAHLDVLADALLRWARGR